MALARGSLVTLMSRIPLIIDVLVFCGAAAFYTIYVRNSRKSSGGESRPTMPLQVYHIFTTLSEEVAVMFPQKWNRGRSLFTFIRYGMPVYMAMHLLRDFKNYFILNPLGCKALIIMENGLLYLIFLVCNASLGLCLGALLRVERLGLLIIMLLCTVMPLVELIFTVIGDAEYPAEPLSSFDIELGYPCYALPTNAMMERTVVLLGYDVCAYVELATTSALLLVNAIFNTPAIMSLDARDNHPAFMLFDATQRAAIPILAQRLLINIRKADQTIARSYASALLSFSPFELEEDEDEKPDESEDVATFETSSAERQPTEAIELEAVRGDIHGKDFPYIRDNFARGVFDLVPEEAYFTLRCSQLLCLATRSRSRSKLRRLRAPRSRASHFPSAGLALSAVAVAIWNSMGYVCTFSVEPSGLQGHAMPSIMDQECYGYALVMIVKGGSVEGDEHDEAHAAISGGDTYGAVPRSRRTPRIRFGQAITNTPAILTPRKRDTSAWALVIKRANFTVVPVLAQRLMINLRRADYMGSEPVASKLLFATPASSADPDIADDDGT
ncbi:hypothetical protein NMY22_g2107 [Coprinellus aureogranulatus]|nr:hypothetical protein NMY22_g2107 [Coprinellus aureogranulatus]